MQELAFHLSSIQGCLLRTRDDVLHLSEAFHSTEQRNALMASSAQLLRSCLHMYNALEEGLNYLDDCARSVPEVRRTMYMAELLLEAVNAFPAAGGDVLEVHSIGTPVTMLRNTLAVILEEIVAPEKDPAMQQRQALLFAAVTGDSSRQKR